MNVQKYYKNVCIQIIIMFNKIMNIEWIEYHLEALKYQMIFASQDLATLPTFPFKKWGPYLPLTPLNVPLRNLPKWSKSGAFISFFFYHQTISYTDKIYWMDIECITDVQNCFKLFASVPKGDNSRGRKMINSEYKTKFQRFYFPPD